MGAGSCPRKSLMSLNVDKSMYGFFLNCKGEAMSEDNVYQVNKYK